MRQPPLQLDSSSARPRKWLPGSRLTVVCATVAALLAGAAHAGDILRGGATTTSARENSAARNNSGAEAAAAARTRAQDRLSRTTKAVADMRQLQEAARAAAAATDPGIPDGLVINGLERYQPGEANFRWDGAGAPVQAGNDITITQNLQQAILHWKTFNVGKNTQVNFDQSAGGADSGKWIAFNKVLGSVAPSQIRGKINANGQVYIINQSGIIFGAGSQVNARTLVASSLPLNDTLIQRGLLNNPDAQFLLSSTFAAPGTTGDIIVEKGALLASPPDADDNGGRVMLVGANVFNQGEILTPSGQSILAAGLQIGIQAHAQDDPSLRGLDVWVGASPAGTGTVSNTGLIEAKTGSILLTGKQIDQLGVLESTTSVSLNGRIDIVASYGAVRNVELNAAVPAPFIYQYSGNVRFGSGSVTRILPDFLNGKSIPGTALPQRSRMNILGESIVFEGGAMTQIPNGIIEMRAGRWPYQDTNGDGTTLGVGGLAELGLSSQFRNGSQILLFDKGSVVFQRDSFIDVAGSTEVFVPLKQSLLEVELRGTEFADSPLQRQGTLRGLSLTVDTRKTGVYDGRYWTGTPLGDVSGFAGLVERNVFQLTAVGGSVTVQAGTSIGIARGGTIDVSGGYFRNEGGKIRTTRLLAGGQIIDIASATPDRIYDGIYTGTSQRTHAKWGVTRTYAHSLAPTGERTEQPYISGADGGQISLIAPQLDLQGDLLGMTVEGPRQRSNLPQRSQLTLRFEAERIYTPELPVLRILTHSPNPAAVVIASRVDGIGPIPLGETPFLLSPEIFTKNGFGSVTISNVDGSVSVVDEVVTPVAGSFSVAASNISVKSGITAPSGTLAFRTYNLSPSFVEEFNILDATLGPDPLPRPDRGLFTLSPGASLNVGGISSDERNGLAKEIAKPISPDAGSIFIEAYSADLAPGSRMDASGGVRITTRNTSTRTTYGKGGSISILTGRDLSLTSVTGGSLRLGSELSAFSGIKGGSLSLRAQLVQIGGASQIPNTLILDPAFFRKGGFTNYSLTGIGMIAPVMQLTNKVTEYIPAVLVTPGTVIEPVAENWISVPFPKGGGAPRLVTMLKSVGERSPVSIQLSAIGADDDFTLDVLEARGDVVIGSDAVIRTDPEATISLNGNTVTLDGSLIAPGGSISIQGADRFPLPRLTEDVTSTALPTVVIGPRALVSAAGTTVLTPNSYGQKTGRVLPGGLVTIYGNIVAARGATIDVSGASDSLDFHPSSLGRTISSLQQKMSGVTQAPRATRSESAQIDSRGGLIELEGSQMLLTDATLKGFAGGPTATGGTLSVHSGRFYRRVGGSITGTVRSTDINLVVQQSGAVLPSTNDLRVGEPVLDPTGKIYTATVGGEFVQGARFAVENFAQGGFGSLELGAKFIESAPNSPIAYGGNIQFEGSVDIAASGHVKLAAGGVIQANADVRIKAPYIVVGQPFRPPLNPNDANVIFRQQVPGAGVQSFGFAPTSGLGSLTLDARLIDIGNLSLQSISRATVISSGDIRGSGTFAIRGDVVFQAAQIYPTTLSTFNIFAYDRLGSSGSITIEPGARSGTPLSIGGSLNLFASTITQKGVLRAPLGSINIGWDGVTDYDLSDPDIDPPSDPVSRGTVPAPVAGDVRLAAGSITSVSTKGDGEGGGLLFPYGISSDGFSWIDPRGVDVTATGLPEKQVSVAGERVSSEAGSVIDIQGGGDLLASRWTQGIGGSVDRLGTASDVWSSTGSYEAGDLVQFDGQTWSARVDSVGRRPSVGPYWSTVAESYAILPGFSSEAVPYNMYNRGANAGLLDGDPGYLFSDDLTGDRVLTSLRLTKRKNLPSRVGDQVFLESSPSLAAGTYTLLPRRYALFPGAVLVTPLTSRPNGLAVTSEGAFYVSGYQSNGFTGPQSQSPLRSRFEVASGGVFGNRSKYLTYFGNSFFSEAASRLEIATPQRLPQDGGYLRIHGNSGLSLAGSVLTIRPSGGRAAAVDLSSFADIYINGASSTTPAGGVSLNVGLLNSWNPGSLLIGGLRQGGASGTNVEVRTRNLTLNNPGETLLAPDIALVASKTLTVSGDSGIASNGEFSERSSGFVLGQNGVALRVSGDPDAAISRPSIPNATDVLMSVGSRARVSGRSVIFDSTYGSQFSSGVQINADSLTFGSGQISILFGPPETALTGSQVPQHLVLVGSLLSEVQRARRLTLRSYRSVDVYGSGSFGSSTLENLRFSASGLRVYGLGAQTTTFSASTVTFENPLNLAPPAVPGPVLGSVVFSSDVTNLGVNSFPVTGVENLVLNARQAILGTATRSQPGTFSTQGNLSFFSPLIAGAQGATQSVTAGGSLVLRSTGARSPGITPGLGGSFNFTGLNILADTSVILPSGEVVMRALGGGIEMGGQSVIDVAGTQQQFYDLTRFTSAGRVALVANLGNVILRPGSVISVAGSGRGEAGTISISVPTGDFLNQGALFGHASDLDDSGTFLLDAVTFGTYSNLNQILTSGGFFRERNLRARSGSLLVDGLTTTRDLTLSADTGDITITGIINSRGATGGKVVITSGRSVTLAAGAVIDAHGGQFTSSGQGGDVRLEAGAAVNGVADLTAILDLQAGATIDLGVDAFLPGLYTDLTSSAFRGQFPGTLHLRAPRFGNTVRIDSIESSIIGASAVVAEAFRVYDRTGAGQLDNALRDTIDADSTSFIAAGYAGMEATLLAGSTTPNLSDILVIAPGVEIVNRTGDLIIGTDANDSGNDWDLSGFRYGPKNAPGVLTLRAANNLQFKNALSDGFAGDFSPNDFGDVPLPGQELWLRPLMDIVATLPVNAQSWSYRLTGGSDVTASDFQRVRPLDSLAANTGSVLVGKFYAQNLVSGTAATTAEAINNRFQVVRTGAGSIDVAAGRDVQLRNQFSTIYTAGVRLPYSNAVFGESEVRLMSIYGTDDFAVPLVELSTSHPDQGGLLGAFQQAYAAQYAMAGGDVNIFAQNDIGRFTFFGGQVVVDSSRQLPNNWLYRRGFVDPVTGNFAPGGLLPFQSDRSASTTWWVDFSNFFQGFGTLGGGDVSLIAGRDAINADAIAATNARMPGLLGGVTPIAPNLSRLVELGGGDVSVRTGRNIDGGVYYVERGQGELFARGEIKTNSARSPSLGLLGPSFEQPLEVVQSRTPTSVFDPLTWLPTTLFAGKAQFDVSAGGNVLLGPITNPFWLPQGVSNKFWYKTYFNTYSPDAAVNVSSFGGSVTLRMAVTLPGSTSTTPTLQGWFTRQSGVNPNSPAWFEPWIRLSEAGVSRFPTVSTVATPTLRATAFAGDINIAGAVNLYPSPNGNLELAASKGIVGLQPTGKSRLFLPTSTTVVTVWSAATVNVSDADPNIFPNAVTPIAYQSLVGSNLSSLQASFVDPFRTIRPSFQETGSYIGSAASIDAVRARHSSTILHNSGGQPVRLYAGGGDITALTLFSPKATRIAAFRDVSDVSFYIQNTFRTDISLVAAGRNIIPYNANTNLRTIADDLARGNFVSADSAKNTATGTPVKALQGDIQINGPGVLQVLAGRDIDLGTGPNFADGTGSGITSIGNRRNLFLPFDGSDLIILSGVPGTNGGAALGLTGSILDFTGFSNEYLTGASINSAYLKRAGLPQSAAELTPEQRAIVSLEEFYRELRESGRESLETGSYDRGFSAISTLLGSFSPKNGNIFTRGRDLRSSTGGAITVFAPGGGVTLAADVIGNPLTPPGIVTEYGGSISIFTDGDVDLGRGRIFTLRGGDITIWSSTGDIAAGTAPKNEITAPPTRIVFDSTSADVQTDPGGLATGGGIGVLASIAGVVAGDVDLIAPAGVVDAGDAGIRATGNLNIAATAVLNAGNINVGGSSSGVPTSAPAAAPNIGGLTAGSSTSAASSSAAQSVANQARTNTDAGAEEPSIIVVEVLGYGGDDE